MLCEGYSIFILSVIVIRSPCLHNWEYYTNALNHLCLTSKPSGWREIRTYITCKMPCPSCSIVTNERHQHAQSHLIVCNLFCFNYGCNSFSHHELWVWFKKGLDRRINMVVFALLQVNFKCLYLHKTCKKMTRYIGKSTLTCIRFCYCWINPSKFQMLAVLYGCMPGCHHFKDKIHNAWILECRASVIPWGWAPGVRVFWKETFAKLH